MQTDTINHEQKRIELASELRSKGITDENVLQAIEKVPRHLFFPKDDILSQNNIYENVAMPIGGGATISRPFVGAFQAELLRIKPKDKALEIGTGSGYLAALLCEMGATVYTIEILHPIFEYAKTNLHSTGYNKVSCYRKDGYGGLAIEAPFDKIIVTVCLTELPRELLKQLKVGGLIVLPFGTTTNCQLIRLTKKAEDQYGEEEVWDGFAFANIDRETIYP